MRFSHDLCPKESYIKVGCGIFHRRPATLNFWIDQFETYIRVQEANLHQNHTSVEKILFWSKMAFTLCIAWWTLSRRFTDFVLTFFNLECTWYYFISFTSTYHARFSDITIRPHIIWLNVKYLYYFRFLMNSFNKIAREKAIWSFIC